MARIGLRHIVAAPITDETAGQPITYGAGAVIGKGIQANLTINRNDNPLYADDGEAENDNGITGVMLELGLDDLLNPARELVLGEKGTQEGTGPVVYRVTEEAAPYVGVGYVQVLKRGGILSYECYWCHKTQFGQPQDNAQTKSQQIEWGTQTITGRVMAVIIDEAQLNNYYEHAHFETLAAAVAWVNGKANIGTTTQETQETQETP